MKTILREVGLLLDQFRDSDWRDLYIRTERYSLFLAKPTGAPNPLRSAEPSKAAPDDARSASSFATIFAPHLATVKAMASVGSVVQPGSIVGQLDVLGVSEDIVATAAGTVSEILSAVGSLVEYETPLLRIV